jgi:hypothetical protein
VEENRSVAMKKMSHHGWFKKPCKGESFKAGDPWYQRVGLKSIATEET